MRPTYETINIANAAIVVLQVESKTLSSTYVTVSTDNLSIRLKTMFRLDAKYTRILQTWPSCIILSKVSNNRPIIEIKGLQCI